MQHHSHEPVTHAVQRARFAGTACLVTCAGLLLLWGCDRRLLPTEPGNAGPAQPAAPTYLGGMAGAFSERARLPDPERHRLVSSPQELAAGTYRYAVAGGESLLVERDDFLIIDSGEPIVRRVLSSERVGGELVVETGHAYWHEVVRGGTYGITMPLGGAATTATTATVASAATPGASGSGTMELPVVRVPLRGRDICQWVDEAMADAPGGGIELCGTHHTLLDQTHSQVNVKVQGQIDTLRIVGGSVALTGDMDIAMTVSAGSLSGGTPPVFAPCNRGNFAGCLATPTGAAFIEFLRTWAPSVPEASLPPVRVCVPGTQVRVRAGYWDRSGLVPRWVPPVFETCRVSSIGTLPTVVLPALQHVQTEIRPKVSGELTTRATGDGKVSVKVTIPNVGFQTAYNAQGFEAKLAVGFFLRFELSLLNAGATMRFTFDGASRLQQRWNPASGWSSDVAITDTDTNAQLLDIIAPDSIVVRTGLVMEFTPELCLSVVECGEGNGSNESNGSNRSNGSNGSLSASDLLSLGAKLEISYIKFAEAAWTRVPVHPTDLDIDNWMIGVDLGEEATVGASISLPDIPFFEPPVPLEWEETFELSRAPVTDLWGRGFINIETVVTGSQLPVEDFEVTVERYDTLPVVIRSGATRIGPALDHGRPRSARIAPGTSRVMGPATDLPCAAFYTDAIAVASNWAGQAVEGLKTLGVELPSYVLTASCTYLIARHVVTLNNVPDNCTVVNGGPVRDDVWLRPRNWRTLLPDMVTVVFEIECGNTPTGSLELRAVAATTPSTTADYLVLIGGSPWGRLVPGETRTLPGVGAGSRTVTLLGGPTNCAALAPEQVDVPVNGTAQLNFHPICMLPDEPPDQLTLGVTTSGDAQPSSPLVVRVDGAIVADVLPTGTVGINGLTPQVPSVVQLTGVAPHCRTTSPNPFTVRLDAGGTPMHAALAFDCTADPITTLDGTVETSTTPVPSTRLRLADGSTVMLVGPAHPELYQFAGSRVVVRGVRAGAVLDVYGYDLDASVLDPRWAGIVTRRGADTWLFGREALRLTGTPAELLALDGALVWVSGVRTGEEVRVQLFGVIREAQP